MTKALNFWDGGYALSDSLTVKASEEVGKGEAAGERETDLAIALLALARITSTAGFAVFVSLVPVD